MFSAEGRGLAAVQYQWQFNGVNISWATNMMLLITNVQSYNEGSYQVVVSDGNGSITSPPALFTLVTPPIITSFTTPTNLVCIYGNHPSFRVTATAPGQANGFPLSYQWKLNGTNITSATSNSYTFGVTDDSSGIYSVRVANAAGSTNVYWWLTVTNTINVTNDLLLIYNTNSADSIFVKNYYLAHRPMVGGANVLGIGCPAQESVTRANYTNTIRQPVLIWLTNNPTKRPQYYVLFLDVPSRIHYDTNYSAPPPEILDNSVSYELFSTMPNNPFVTHIDMNGTNDCKAYIDKLEFFGTNFSPGSLMINASASGYGSTNYYFDDVRDPNYAGAQTNPPSDYAGQAKDGVLAINPAASVAYTNGNDFFTNLTIHITAGTNVAGYLSWGTHSALGGLYPTDGKVKWHGNSSWWIIETVESWNGQRYENGMGNFIQWFSSNAFGGTNYSNTPIGAVCHTDEPGLGGANNAYVYFSLWAGGKNFAITAWSSRSTRTPHFQAVGDPLIKK